MRGCTEWKIFIGRLSKGAVNKGIILGPGHLFFEGREWEVFFLNMEIASSFYRNGRESTATNYLTGWFRLHFWERLNLQLDQVLNLVLVSWASNVFFFYNALMYFTVWIHCVLSIFLMILPFFFVVVLKSVKWYFIIIFITPLLVSLNISLYICWPFGLRFLWFAYWNHRILDILFVNFREYVLYINP